MMGIRYLVVSHDGMEKERCNILMKKTTWSMIRLLAASWSSSDLTVFFSSAFSSSLLIYSSAPLLILSPTSSVTMENYKLETESEVGESCGNRVTNVWIKGIM